MRGRPDCPTELKKNSVRATAGRSPLFYKERLGTKSPPHPTRLRRPTFPPRGRLWGVGRTLPVRETTLPARPAGGRAVTDVGLWAAGQAKKKEDPRRVPPTRKGGSREEETLPPWCSFLRLSSKESRAPARSRAGNHVAGPTLRRSKKDPPIGSPQKQKESAKGALLFHRARAGRKAHPYWGRLPAESHNWRRPKESLQ